MKFWFHEHDGHIDLGFAVDVMRGREKEAFQYILLYAIALFKMGKHKEGTSLFYVASKTMSLMGML